MILEDVLDAVPGARLVAGAAFAADGFTRASVDTRDLVGGELFVAVRGDRDGHDFVEQAAARGARGVVVAADVPPLPGVAVVRVPDTLAALQRSGAAVRRRCAPSAVAVTGSAGKTTTKTMIAEVLATRFDVVANHASFNNHLGVPLTLSRLDPRHTHLVAEIGTNHRGEVAHLVGLVDPDVAVVTGIGSAHLGNFAGRHELAQEKVDLLRGTRAAGTWVLNGDDDVLTGLAAELPGASTARTLRVGFGPGNDLEARDVRVDGRGTHATVRVHGARPRDVDLHLATPGRHFVRAAMLALAVGAVHGIDVGTGAERLATVHPPVGRATVRRPRPDLLVVDDSYNASPDAMLAALDLLATLGGATRIAVLGEMGELGRFSADLHRRVGAAAAAAATHLVTVGDGAAPLRAEAVARGMTPSRVVGVASALDAGELVDRLLGPVGAEGAGGQVVVLVKGSRFRHMERVGLALGGRVVRCALETCPLYVNCAGCSRLAPAG